MVKTIRQQMEGREALSPAEIKIVSACINCFSDGGHPMAEPSTIMGFGLEFAVEMINAGLACKHAAEDWPVMKLALAKLEAKPADHPVQS